MDSKERVTDIQTAQQELIACARTLPGVAAALDVYAQLAPYSELFNVQPAQCRNAAGGNGL
jgi:hypothetical protein